MKTNCGVYKITNLIPNEKTGICKVYIGSSVNFKSRKYNHFNDLEHGKHSNEHLQRAFKRDNIENFKWEILEDIGKIEDKTELKKNLLDREQYYLNEFIVNGEIDRDKCYNINPTAGSNLGIKCSEESIKKRALANTGKKRTTETREKMKESALGKIVSEETKKKQSEVAFNRTEEQKENYRKGKLGSTHSEETKEKMREAHKYREPITEETRNKMKQNNKHKPSYGHYGKTHSERVKEKIKFAKLGSKHSEETKIKMSNSNEKATAKEVINLDTKKFFNSLTEASKFYNISISHISAVCRGKRKTAGKYRWSYVSSLYNIENLEPISVEGALKIMLGKGMPIEGISITTGLIDKMEED